MKHCHFSICYNELPFLKQKLNFLYALFDQIIFYDLGIIDCPYKNSNDGSIDYIKNFPDPEHKILLLAEKKIEKIRPKFGTSTLGKRQMFEYGSRFVNKNINVFWCTDMDEFFTKKTFLAVERIFKNFKVNSISIPHYIFWKNFELILGDNISDTMWLQSRIARHFPGNIYGHCTLAKQFPPTYKLINEKIYHFAYIGAKRFKLKSQYLPIRKNYDKIWKETRLDKITNKLYNFPNMHPNPIIKKGIKKFNGSLPEYINKEILYEDLSK